MVSTKITTAPKSKNYIYLLFRAFYLNKINKIKHFIGVLQRSVKDTLFVKLTLSKRPQTKESL
jgi:hypothetical protein